MQNQNEDVAFLMLSIDRSIKSWKRGVEKYKLEGNHYYITEGLDGAFGDFLNSNWIPRYMILDKKGNIKLFKATNTNDKRIKEALQ